MAIVSATASTRNLILVGLNAAEANTPDQWGVAAVGDAAEVDVVTATTDPGGLQVRLGVGPGMSPGETYTVTSGDIAGVQTCVCPNTAPALSDEWNHGMIRTLTRTFAEGVQELSGAPVTILLDDWTPGQTTVRVESTLGFPAAGSVLVDGKRIAYTSKGPMAFKGCTSDTPPGVSIPTRTEAVCDVTAII